MVKAGESGMSSAVVKRPKVTVVVPGPTPGSWTRWVITQRLAA